MNVPAPLAQLVSLGFVWVFFHCAGMCGPIVGGLKLGGARGLLLYQGGRALTLASAGALAGLVGARATDAWRAGGPALALVAAIGMGAVALHRIAARPAPAPVAIGGRGRVARFGGALWARAVPLLFSLGALRPFALGLLLGFLPCMIVAWALSLAAASASPAMGALVMATLVLMTTPTLGLATVVAGVVARVLPRALRGASSAWLMLVSAGWMWLVALAGFGVIEHRHAHVTLGGADLTIMFY